MSATGAEPLTAARAPLPADALPPSVARVLAGGVPGKLMAIKGMAPLRPAELAMALYQLSFDPDAKVKEAAEGAPAALPDKVILAPLSEPLPGAVLHFFAERLAVARIEPLEKLLYNPATADETFVMLAGRLRERELEVIVQNEARLLRCPAIVQALYFNSQARMSSLNRAIELLARNNVRVEGIPAFDEVAKSILADSSAKEPAADAAFENVLQVTAAAEVPDGDATGTPGPEDPKKKSVIIDFGKLKLHEKIRLATLGNAYCRTNLIRDSNKVVAMAAIRSPLLTDSEVVRASANRQVCEDVIRYVANQRDFTKLYQVRINLVLNPKCPLALSLRMMNLLKNEDIKTIARSKNVPSALATAAKKLVQTRKIGG